MPLKLEGSKKQTAHGTHLIKTASGISTSITKDARGVVTSLWPLFVIRRLLKCGCFSFGYSLWSYGCLSCCCLNTELLAVELTIETVKMNPRQKFTNKVSGYNRTSSMGTPLIISLSRRSNRQMHSLFH